MAKINLRPWREEKAQERQKEFSVNILAAALFSGIAVFGIGYYFDEMQGRQEVRNNYLKSETAILDKKLDKIRDLKKKRQQLLDRLNAIQELQGTRPLIVRNFDELVRLLPAGIYYTSLSRTGDFVAVEGRAEDKLDVSSLMRNLDRSIWFGEPELSKVEDSEELLNLFLLTVPIIKPSEDKINE